MVSVIYVVLGTLLLIKLSLDVVRLSTQYRVTDGNAVEYLPIGLILLLIIEMDSALNWTL